MSMPCRMSSQPSEVRNWATISLVMPSFAIVVPRWRWTCFTESSMGGRLAVLAATSGSMTSMSSPSILPPARRMSCATREVAARAAADAGGVEPGGLDEDVFGLRGDHGVPASHDSGEAEGLLFVGDDEVVGFEGALGAVEELELLSLLCEADYDAA